ncbi:hypothetical protein J6590_017211 [Homalodisca vitripennis]|nr:hypothetical protein J6590_017211 [Homalodisca vitripennis]
MFYCTACTCSVISQSTKRDLTPDMRGRVLIRYSALVTTFLDHVEERSSSTIRSLEQPFIHLNPSGGVPNYSKHVQDLYCNAWTKENYINVSPWRQANHGKIWSKSFLEFHEL